MVFLQDKRTPLPPPLTSKKEKEQKNKINLFKKCLKYLNIGGKYGVLARQEDSPPSPPAQGENF